MLRNLFFLFCLTCIGLINAQPVNIPDANFKNALLANAAINTNADGDIDVSEAAAYTGGLSLISLGITDLTGIEAFTQITSLNCGSNSLTTLDVSMNTQLTSLYCDYNSLTSLDVTALTSLQYLYCNSNQITSLDLQFNTALTHAELGPNNLTSLDVSNNINLIYLHCVWNQIPSLDLSNNPNITDLSCANNLITSLSISHLTGLTWFDCNTNNLTSLSIKTGNNANMTYFSCHTNPGLSCIEVDNPSYSSSASNWYKDAAAFYNTTCSTVGGFIFQSTVCTNINVLFTDTSSNATSWYWDLGDGNTSTAQSPVHYYTSAGTYTVVQIAYGLNGNDTVSDIITVMPPPAVDAGADVSVCAPDSVTLYASGAMSYNWSLGMAGPVFSFAPAQTVSVVLTGMDFFGCSNTDTVVVFVSPQMSLAFSPVSSTCGSSNGSISASVTGGTGPFAFTWSDGSNGTSLTSIPAGMYFVAVTDANGCYTSGTGFVDDNNGPVVTLASITNVTCGGGSDGAISTTVSGGTAPLDVQWMNGETTSSLSNIHAGVYDLVVTDNAGCTVYRSYTVTEPQALYLWGSWNYTSGCLMADGVASVSVTGGTAPYSYLWDASAGNQTTSTVNLLPAGAYKVIVADVNGCSDSTYVSVSDYGAHFVYVDSMMNAGCISAGNIGSGAIYISVYSGSGNYSYSWSNGTTNQNATNLGKGVYGVEVTDVSTGCVASASQYIYGIQPGTPEICLVTVDTATNRNIIIWNNDIAGIATYQIYRETSVPGNFTLIASIPADSTNEFTDTLANAGVQPWNYEIRVVDSCDFVSLLSVTHESIFLTISQQSGGIVNLDWTAYSGTSFSQYYIYRKGTMSPWTLIDSVPANTLAYSDVNAPADSLDYLIEIQPDSVCNTSRAIINTSRSNIKSQIVVSTGLASADNTSLLNVYPNPANEQITLKVQQARQQKFSLNIYNTLGQSVYSKNFDAVNVSENLSVKEFAAGIYFVELRAENSIKTVKIIKN